MILAGELDRLINIRAAAGTLSAAGEMTAAGALIFTNLAAGIRTPKGHELEVGGRDGNITQRIFRVRFQSSVNESLIVEYEGTDWRILWMQEIGRREALDLYTEKIR